jgi:hypothetical protein
MKKMGKKGEGKNREVEVIPMGIYSDVGKSVTSLALLLKASPFSTGKTSMERKK